jgi:CHAD domain-containing protein
LTDTRKPRRAATASSVRAIPASALLIRQRLSELRRGLVGARVGDVTAIHQTRVATRRLREALPLVTSGSAGRKLDRGVRRLTRALGPVRELDVALENLNELDAAGEVPRAGIECLRQLILAERRVLFADAVKGIDRFDVPKMRRKAAAATDRTRPADGSPAHDARHAASAQRRAAKRAERLRAAIDNAAGIYLPDRLHKVRIAVKKLRYSIEIAQQVAAPRRGRPATRQRSARSVKGQIAVLKRAQDLLGRMHDLEVLIARTRAVQGSPGAPSLRLSGDLDRLVRRLETDCRQLHGHYMAARSQLLDLCDRVTVAAERPAQRPSAA